MGKPPHPGFIHACPSSPDNALMAHQGGQVPSGKSGRQPLLLGIGVNTFQQRADTFRCLIDWHRLSQARLFTAKVLSKAPAQTDGLRGGRRHNERGTANEECVGILFARVVILP